LAAIYLQNTKNNTIFSKACGIFSEQSSFQSINIDSALRLYNAQFVTSPILPFQQHVASLTCAAHLYFFAAVSTALLMPPLLVTTEISDEFDDELLLA